MRTHRFGLVGGSIVASHALRRRAREIRPQLESCEDRKLLSVTLAVGPVPGAVPVETRITPMASGWKQIGGSASNIYAGSFGLVATNPTTGNLYRYLGTPNKWVKIGGPGRTFVQDTSGHLYALSPDYKGVYQYVGNGTTNKWVKIGGPSAWIYAGSFGLVSASTSGNLYRYLGTPNSWAQIGGLRRMWAMGPSGSLYALAYDSSAVYRYTGNGFTNSWIKIGGPASNIYAGSFGLVATNPTTGNLYRYLGTPNKWALIGGPGKSFAVGTSLYGLSPDLQGVFKYVGNGTNWAWTKIGGPADAIAVSATGNSLVALSPKVRDVWMYS